MERLEWILLGAALANKGWRDVIAARLSRDDFTDGDLFAAVCRGDHPSALAILKLPTDQPILRAIIAALRLEKDRDLCRMTANRIDAASRMMSLQELVAFTDKCIGELRQKVELVYGDKA